MIIDARVRLPEELRPPVNQPKREEYHVRYNEVLNLDTNRTKSLQDLIDEMDKCDVEHAIIHAEYEYGYEYDVDMLNEAVALLVKKHPHRFSGFGTISMEHFKVMRAVKQVNKIAELGLIGVNIQPSFFGMSINDGQLYPIYAKAQELGLAVALHTGINYSMISPIKNEHPLLLDKVACDFPGLTLIACHAAWPWIPDMVAVARKHPDILIDFGGLSPKYLGVRGSGWEMMYHFMNNLLKDQILFATDWPVFPMKRAIQEWKELNLKQEVLDKLLRENALRLISNHQNR